MNSKIREFLFGLILSVILNALLSAVAPVMFGGHLTLIGWAQGWALCTVISLLLSAILPMGKIGAAFASSLGAAPDSCAGQLLSNMLMSTIFGVVLVFAMVAVSTGFGDLGGISFAERYVSGLIAIWPVVVVCLTFSVFLAGMLLSLGNKKKA